MGISNIKLVATNCAKKTGETLLITGIVAASFYAGGTFSNAFFKEANRLDFLRISFFVE